VLIPTGETTMRRLRSFAFVMAVSAAILPAAAARAGDPITLYGSGWGHGLGLSQWGAYGLAKQGWSSSKILRHFYSGTVLSEVTDPPGDIRIALTSGEDKIHLTAEAGPVRLSIGQPVGGTLVGKIPAGETWVVRVVDGAYEVHDAAGGVVGGTTWGGVSSDLFATFADHGARVTVPEGGATYNRGVLEFNLTACHGGCAIRVILRVPFEEYLLGIGEVPSSWPMEALRAQAIAARSFALYKISKYGVQDSCGCDLTDGSNDQVYIGWDKEGGDDGQRWVKAVQSTADTIVSYQGNVALTVFTASDGGHTEDLNVQWGTPLSAYPYLAGVCDPGDFSSANPWNDWSRQFSGDDLTTSLRPYTGNVGAVTGFGAIERGVSGRIASAVVHGADADASVTGSELRSALSLPDDRVWINADKNVLGAIRTKYDALMCRPGLPTSPSKTLPGGSRQTFRTGAIYRNGTADVTVWLKGAVYDEYLAVGGAPGTLGFPMADPVNVAKARGLPCPSGCTRADFDRGLIYWKGGVGAFALWGDVLAFYLERGGAEGTLGFPTSRVQHADDGRESATFEHGTIRCSSGGGCHVS
jgi:SpoIID/LytB domain protein